MLSAVVTLAVFIAAWLAAWFLFLRHWLMQYKTAAGIIGRVEDAEGDAWTQVKLWLEAKKTLILGIFVSGFGAGKAAIDSTVTTAASLTPTDVAPLHDPNIWQAFFSDAWVMRIMSALAIAMSVLAVRGHLTAAKIEPEA